MPQTPLGTYHQQLIKESLASNDAGADLITIVVAKSGTLKTTTRRRMDLLCADIGASKRICDIIDAGTGTIGVKDRSRLLTGLADYGLGNAVANAINGV